MKNSVSPLKRRLMTNWWLVQNCKDVRTALILKGYAHPKRDRQYDQLRLRGLDRAILYRPGSTDVSVAWELFHTGEYAVSEPWPFRTVVDAGANCGMFMLWVLRQSAGALTNYVGIEADADSFRVLEQQAKASGLTDRATLVNAAIWERDGSVTFETSGPSWGHRVNAGGSGNVVKAMTLQSILDAANLPSCDLLKLDIEGGERQVLPAILSSCPERFHAVVAELHDELDYDWFARVTERAGFVSRPPGALFNSHPGAVRRGSPFERLL